VVNEFLNRIDESVELMKDRNVIVKTRQAIQANRHRCEEPRYEVGDLVHLDMKNLRLKVKQKGCMAKFYPRFIGPFPIIKAIPETSSYKLDLPDMYKIHPTFHTKLLRPFILNDPDRFPAREPPRPGPVFENEDGDGDDYEVESIWDHRETV